MNKFINNYFNKEDKALFKHSGISNKQKLYLTLNTSLKKKYK